MKQTAPMVPKTRRTTVTRKITTCHRDALRRDRLSTALRRDHIADEACMSRCVRGLEHALRVLCWRGSCARPAAFT
eukprot:2244960-Rhodomonas_salina.1